MRSGFSGSSLSVNLGLNGVSQDADALDFDNIAGLMKILGLRP
jgi:hypothetical protein